MFPLQPRRVERGELFWIHHGKIGIGDRTFAIEVAFPQCSQGPIAAGVQIKRILGAACLGGHFAFGVAGGHVFVRGDNVAAKQNASAKAF